MPRKRRRPAANVQKMLLDIKEEERKEKKALVKKSKHRRKSKAQLEERRTQVSKCLMRGMSVPEIQSFLGASESEVRNDVKVLREQNIRMATGLELTEFVGESLRVYARVEQEAFVQYEESPQDKKGQFLNIILSARKDQTKFLETMGVVKSQPVETQIKVEHQIVQLPDESLRQVRGIMLENHLKKELSEPEPPKEEILEAEYA